MSNRPNSKLLVNDHTLILLPKLAKAIGLNEAIFLQQLHFLLIISEQSNKREKYVDGKWWNYNSYKTWRTDQFPFWSEMTIRRIVKALEEIGLIETAQLSGIRWDKRKWYTINYEKLDTILENPSLIGGCDGEDENGNSRYVQNEQIDLSKLNKSTSPVQNEQIDAFNSNKCNSVQPEQTSLEKNTLNQDSLLNSDAGGVGNKDPDSEDALENNCPEQTRESSLSSGKADSDLALEEPEYTDTYEEGNELEGGKRPMPKWRFPTKHELCRLAFEATGRKYFSDREERSRWLTIENDIAPFDIIGRVKYPDRYVQSKIDWAKRMNSEYRRKNETDAVRIKFPSLLSLIGNKEQRDEWVSRAAQDPRKYCGNPWDGNDEEIFGDPGSVFDEILEEEDSTESPW